MCYIKEKIQEKIKMKREYASRGHERSHIDGVQNPVKVLKGYLWV